MVTLDGSRLTFDEVRRVSTGDERVEIAAGAIGAMQRSRAVVERLAAGDTPVYAVNTGVGLLADVRVPPEQLEQLQRNVVRSQACGVGEPLTREEVRAMMLIRFETRQHLVFGAMFFPVGRDVGLEPGAELVTELEFRRGEVEIHVLHRISGEGGGRRLAVR